MRSNSGTAQSLYEFCEVESSNLRNEEFAVSEKAKYIGTENTNNPSVKSNRLSGSPVSLALFQV